VVEVYMGFKDVFKGISMVGVIKKVVPTSKSTHLSCVK
jgi:hypothetical protein